MLMIFATLTHSFTIDQPRAPAEFEETEAVILSISRLPAITRVAPSHGYDIDTLYRHNFIRYYKTIVDEIIASGAKVYLVDSMTAPLLQDMADCGIVMNDKIQSFLYATKDSKGRAYAISRWARDVQLPSVYNKDGTLFFAGMGAAPFVGEALGLPVFVNNNPVVSSSYSDGGNYLTDGHHTLFLDGEGFYRNKAGVDTTSIHRIYRDTLGMNRIIEMSKFLTHLDYGFKLVDEETFVYYQTRVTDSVVAALAPILKSCYGRPYKFYPIVPTPYNSETDHNLYWNLDAISYYSNSLICNKSVFVPATSVPGIVDFSSYDNAAADVYKKAMPGYKVVLVPGIILEHVKGGSVHCLTHEIAKPDPIFVSHPWYKDTAESMKGAFPVKAYITAASGVKKATLYWKKMGAADFSQVQLIPTLNDTFTAEIPAGTYTGNLQYYIGVENNKGRTMAKPLPGAEGPWTFYGVGSGTKIEEDDMENHSSLLSLFPIPFNPSTTVSFWVSNEASKVNTTLQVVSAQGKVVSTLLNSKQIAGQKHVVWNATGYPSGVYFFRLQTGASIQVTKGLYLK